MYCSLIARAASQQGGCLGSQEWKWKWNGRRRGITGGSSVLDGKSPLYGVVSHEEVEDEGAVEDGEDLPAVTVDLEDLLERVALGLRLRLQTGE